MNKALTNDERAFATELLRQVTHRLATARIFVHDEVQDLKGSMLLDVLAVTGAMAERALDTLSGMKEGIGGSPEEWMMDSKLQDLSGRILASAAPD